MTRVNKGRTQYLWRCPGCGYEWNGGHWVEASKPPSNIQFHYDHCDSLKLVRLRNDLRALIERWRAESGNWQVDRCADELERAIGDGRG